MLQAQSKLKEYNFVSSSSGGGIPETLDEPILVGIYDMETMGIMVDAKRVDSLKSYLETIQEN